MPSTRKVSTAPARALRHRTTSAERQLWRHLGRVTTDGTHFRRQAPLGPYIVDFVCHGAKLVIELDGSQHGRADHMRADAARSMWLREQGYSVLRFWNGEVTQNLEGVLDTIYAAVRQAETGEVGARTPTPSPSPQGEGERGVLVR